MKISIIIPNLNFLLRKRRFKSRSPFQRSEYLKFIEWLWVKSPKKLKQKIIQIIERKKVEEFIYILRNFQLRYIIRLIYLLGYGSIYVIGTIAEWIWAIITFPFILFYRIMSSRPMAFILNMLLIAAIVGVLFFYDEYSNTKILVDNAVMKLGGEEKLFCHEEDTIKRLKASVVRIVGGEGEGSGFVYLAENGVSYILTNFHVIEYEVSPKVVVGKDDFRKAEIVAANKQYDVAILKVNGELYPVQWGDVSYLHAGEVLLSVGYPLGSNLTGEATFTKGSYNGMRHEAKNDMDYIHTDSTIISGMSGGVMTDVCGRVVGMNTLGGAGIGLAIPSDKLRAILTTFSDSEDQLQDIQIIEFKPDESAVEAVRAFYNYIRIGKYEKAFELVSPELLADRTLDEMTEGYSSTLQTNIVSIVEDPDKEDTVRVKLHAIDLNGDNFIHTYYEGDWIVEKKDEKFILQSATITIVPEPGWLWFYD